MIHVIPGIAVVIKMFVMVIGKTMNVHHTFMKELKQSSNLTEVSMVNGCDVIIAFVSIVSRAGTDIEAALQRIPDSRPVVLVVLHHTFDPFYTPPDSSFCVRNRSDVFAVDCLYHEDQGLLRCPHNDMALLAVKQHLKNVFPQTVYRPKTLRRYQLMCILFLSIFIFLYFFVY